MNYRLFISYMVLLLVPAGFYAVIGAQDRPVFSFTEDPVADRGSYRG